MLKMNHYVHNGKAVSTAEMLRGAATSLHRVADSLDKPNELLVLLSELFNVVTRDNVAEKIEQIAHGLTQCAAELRGPVIDQRVTTNN